jgi:hypothetical protein
MRISSRKRYNETKDQKMPKDGNNDKTIVKKKRKKKIFKRFN